MKSIVLFFAVMGLCLWQQNAAAFWEGESFGAATGLNVASGFDVNTMTTMTGAVVSLPARNGAEQHTVMTIDAPQGAVTVVLGPWWYWERQGVSLTRNQQIAVTGSQAQGEDGALYLFAQKLENRSNGETITLRTESGKPLWRGGGGSGRGAGSGGRGFGIRGRRP